MDYAALFFIGLIVGYAWCYAATRRITRNYKAALAYFQTARRGEVQPTAETDFNSSLDFPDESPVFYEPLHEIDRKKI